MLFVIFIAPAARAADAAPSARALMSHATSGQMWIARVGPDAYSADPQAVKTRLWVGTPGSNGLWVPLEPIAGRAVDLSNLDSELSVLLDSGEWMIAAPSGNRVGPPPPGGAVLRDLASKEDDLWALADVPGGLSMAGPTTRPSMAAWLPATTPNDAATTQPAAVPLPSIPVVFRFFDGHWEAVAPQLPPELVRGAARYSLVIVNRLPVIAFEGPDHQIHVLALSADHVWTATVTLPPEAAQGEFKLLTDQSTLTLWTAAGGPAGTLYIGPTLADVWPLALQGQAPGKIDARSATFGANLYRVVLASGDQAWQQPYDLEKRQALPLQPITLPLPAGIAVLPFVIGGALLTIVATVAAFAQRKPLAAVAGGATLETVTLAPLSARLVAGAVDALPLIAAFLLAANAGRTDDTLQEATLRLEYPWMIATIAYLLHTTLAEAIAGASLGKMMFGLRVVNAQGLPAATGPRVARNLLRILDVIFVFPLASVFFSPLRQRVGDIAAGTTVVLQQPGPEQEEG